MPPYQGRGAFASASPQDFTSGPGKPIASIKGMGMNPSLQATDSGNENDIWLRMGQGADLGDGKGDMVRAGGVSH